MKGPAHSKKIETAMAKENSPRPGRVCKQTSSGAQQLMREKESSHTVCPFPDSSSNRILWRTERRNADVVCRWHQACAPRRSLWRESLLPHQFLAADLRDWRDGAGMLAAEIPIQPHRTSSSPAELLSCGRKFLNLSRNLQASRKLTSIRCSVPKEKKASALSLTPLQSVESRSVAICMHPSPFQAHVDSGGNRVVETAELFIHL